MSTEFVSFQPPPGAETLALWDKHKFAPDQQLPDGFPSLLTEALSVREDVFVKEQGCPLENEVDDDDHRSWHWVTYVSVGSSASTGSAKRASVGGRLPVATVRLVPPPHGPHPDARIGDSSDYAKVGSSNFEDGPYIKIGRVATLKDFRSLGLARLLIETALTWASEHPDEVLPQPSAAEREAVRLETAEDGREALAREWERERWTGLVLVHGQKHLEGWYAKMGFVRDPALGTWDEEGIPHVGMWRRIPVRSKRNSTASNPVHA